MRNVEGVFSLRRGISKKFHPMLSGHGGALGKKKKLYRIKRSCLSKETMENQVIGGKNVEHRAYENGKKSTKKSEPTR